MYKPSSGSKSDWQQYQQGLRAWKRDVMASHDGFESIIIKLAGGRPDLLTDYRRNYTHRQIITAWKSKLING